MPFPPGGNIDFIARTIQPRMSELLGQPIVIENKGGAAGAIGAEYAAKQPADGYTLLLGNTGTLALNLVAYARLPYDTLRDFAAVGQTSANPQLAVVHPSMPGATLGDFLAHVRANPGKFSAAVAGGGSSLHFGTEMMKRQSGVDLQLVFYKGSGPAVTDLIGGQVQFMMDAPPVNMNYVKQGKLRPVAVTGGKRLPALPDVPTFAEAGLDLFDAGGFQGMMVPKGTPPEVIARLSDALARTVADSQVRERFIAQGLEPVATSAEQFQALLRAEIDKWGKVQRETGIRAE